MEKKKKPRQKKKASMSTAAGGNKQEAVKVVYISTPVKLETSPSNFRSLVQELTGQGAVWPFDPSNLSSSSHSFPRNQTLPIPDAHNMDSTAKPLDHDDDDDDRAVLIDRHLLSTVFDDHFAGFIHPVGDAFNT